MNLSSLIDYIKQSIATGASSTISFSEKTLISELLREKGVASDGNPSLGIRPIWQYNPEERFPFLRAVKHIVYVLFMIPIVIIYGVLSMLYYGITRNKKGKLRDNLRTLRTSTRLNAILFITMFVAHIAVACSIVIFFFNDVLLFNPNSSINSYGTISIAQPCGREHHMFLYNTASLWENTGIEILEGDEIEITSSGAFHSKIDNIYESAKQNEKPIYSLSNNAYNEEVKSNQNTQKSLTKQLLIYKDSTDARFGSLLYDIRSEAVKPRFDSETAPIKQIPNGTKYKFTAEQSGYFYLITNDIYLSEPIWNKIKNDDKIIESLQLNQEQIKALDSLVTIKQYPCLWFDDNIGEILVNVTVSHKKIMSNECSPLTLVKEGYSRVYRFVEQDVLNEHWLRNLLLIIGGITMLLCLDEVIAHCFRNKKKRS